MHYFIHSEPGHNHENEDAVAIQAHPNDPGLLICALADGQGGQSGGGAASKLAVAKCLELTSSYPSRRLQDTRTWYEIINGADEAVSDEPEAGFTTLIALCVTKDRVFGASCGDSAAYLVNGNVHTDLTGEQRKNPPVGSSAAFRAAFPAAFSANLQPGWKLLIVSDGVWRSIGDDAICDSDLRDIYDTERHLLYVACTRARDHLLVTSAGSPSDFIDDLRM